jgi:hypothetical protein
MAGQLACPAEPAGEAELVVEDQHGRAVAGALQHELVLTDSHRRFHHLDV